MLNCDLITEIGIKLSQKKIIGTETLLYKTYITLSAPSISLLLKLGNSVNASSLFPPRKGGQAW